VIDLPTLCTARVLLVPLGRQHSAGMFVLWSSELVCRYSGVVSDVDGNIVSTPVDSMADSDLIIDFWIEARRAGWGCRWALELCGTGEFVGAVGFNALGEVCEYAYHLTPAHWGRGLLHEASKPVFEWASSVWGCREVVAVIDGSNDRSISFAQRNGFDRIGPVGDGTDRYAKWIAPQRNSASASGTA